jgi:hypothetical protein
MKYKIHVNEILVMYCIKELLELGRQINYSNICEMIRIKIKNDIKSTKHIPDYKFSKQDITPRIIDEFKQVKEDFIDSNVTLEMEL